MSTTLLVMTDGRRDCISRTLHSALVHLRAEALPFTERIIHDDSGDPDYRAWLAEQFPQFTIISTPGRSGFGGAIRSAWAYLASSDSHFIFHLEDDFVFTEDINVVAMERLLIRQRELVQVALKRQPWNDIERAAGGIIEANPQDFFQMSDGESWWTAHRRFFTTNPSVYHRALLREGWPDGEHSEGAFTHRLLTHRRGCPFAFWGKKFDPPKVLHIGDERAGTGY
jgi:hypothetical protein